VFRAPEAGWGRYRRALRNGWQWFQIDASAATNLDELHEAIASGLDLPEWYGRNLDALADVLGDLRPAGLRGVVIELDGTDRISANPRFGEVLEVFAQAANDHAASGFGMCTLVGGRGGKGLAPLPD
jgi:RNAse (barnase) inhibitor barstar